MSAYRHRDITLYQRPSCPFCARVKLANRYLSLTLQEKNISQDPQALRELIQDGGKQQVPALRIKEADGSHRWLYESREIIEFLADNIVDLAVDVA